MQIFRCKIYIAGEMLVNCLAVGFFIIFWLFGNVWFLLFCVFCWLIEDVVVKNEHINLNKLLSLVSYKISGYETMVIEYEKKER